MMIFELLVVVLVVSLSFGIAKGAASGERTEKKILAEEIRMMVDTLAGVPGEAVVEYPYNVSEYSFLFDKGSIAVFKEGEDKGDWAVREFFLPEDYSAVGVLKGEERLCLEKKEKSILLRKCEVDEK